MPTRTEPRAPCSAPITRPRAGAARRAVMASLLAAAGVACSGGMGRAPDGGLPGADAAHRADADPMDAEAADVARDPLDADAGGGAVGDADAEALDVGQVHFDAEPARPGETCEAAPERPEARRYTGSTTASPGRGQLSCGAPGGSGVRSEAWFSVGLDRPSHVVLRLGTAGWDGVLGARTSTCAAGAEVCTDAPTALELPAALGPVYLGVGGFAGEVGPYALALERAPALEVPPPNADCARATPLAVPGAARGHGFGAGSRPDPSCPLAAAVYYALELPAPASLVLRVEPTAGQDLDLALLDGCGGAVLACGQARGGAAEVLGPTSVGPGRVLVAVGSRADRPRPASFALLAADGPGCARDVDCALGERCALELGCVPRRATTATSSARRAIPDGTGALEVPLSLAAPPGWVTRVRARVTLEHPWPEDLVVELLGPRPALGGAPIRVRLRDRSPGALDVAYGTDRAPDGPGALDDFLLVSQAAGTWRLRVEDRAPGDRGFVTGVALEVESE